jgi:hypothetical protein
VLRANGASRIYGMGFYTHTGMSTYDILQEDANSQIILTAGELSAERMSIINWANVHISFQDRFPQEPPSHIFREEIHVGAAELGRETAMGSGSSTQRGMMVYNYNGSTFTDVTQIAISRTGSTFTMTNGLNSAIYFGWNLKDAAGNYLKFYGLEAGVTAARVLGGGTVVWEYWGGASWLPLTVMAVNKLPPYTSYANAAFSEVATVDIRFNINLATAGTWVANDPISSGTNRYWVRYRVSTAITSGPTIEFIRFHSNRKLIGTDGFVQYFGLARPLNRIAWDVGMLSGTDVGDPAADQGIFLSDTLDVGREQNAFDAGGIDRVGLLKRLPYDCDTSTPIAFQWTWFTVAGGGDVLWNIRWGYSSDGANIYLTEGAAPTTHATQQLITQIIPSAGAGIQITSMAQLDVSGMVARRVGSAGDILWLTLERDGSGGSGDTNTGDAVLVEISPYYAKWSEGGHF